MVETKSGPTETTTLIATMQLARDKNGSTYEAWVKDGHTTVIWISDVLKNRKIEIHPQDSTYFYIPILPPGRKLPIYSMEETFKMLQAEQESNIKSPDHSSAILPRWHFTSLGCRLENGLNLCGVRDEITSNTELQTRETWRSDLGLIMLTTQKADHFAHPINDIQALTHIHTVTNLRRIEPDAKLFVIPEGYAQVPTPEYLQPHASPKLEPSSTSVK